MTEEQVFLSALELDDPADRTAYLDRACGGDAELRRQVDELLAAHFRSGKFLDEPVCVRPETGSAVPIHDYATGPHGTHRTDVVTYGKKPDDEQDGLHFLQPSARPDSMGRIGHYEVLQVIGKGGFGIVFRAFDDVLQRVVALKVLAPAVAATSPARKRFLREARASAQARHENLVQVYAVEEKPTPYLVMEFIPGESLQQRLDHTGPLDAPDVVRLARQIAEGLAAAHATGLIHRDIKPANVLIENGPQGRVKITDFGLARAADDASLSQSGILAGTPMYMAPEQAKGEPLDHRADLFSLGSVMYVMVTGRPPFRAATTYAVLKRVVDDAPRSIRELIPETPQWLADVIARLHAKRPGDRFQSAREVAGVLADYEAQLAATGKVEGRFRPLQQKRNLGRWKWVAAALLSPALALAATEAAGVTSWLRRQPVPDSPQKGEDSGVRPERPEGQDFTNTLGMKFKRIPAGRFAMGSTREEVDRCLREFVQGSGKYEELRSRTGSPFETERFPTEWPVHFVEITRPFYMGATEVTVGQFRKFVDETGYNVGDNDENKPELNQSPDDPVVRVSWDNAVAFCNWLSAKERNRYRLPTEAEWEYCCRAGKDGARYCYGDEDERLGNYAWHQANSGGETHRVGSLKANVWGLHDMHGNAWEWCQDSFDPNYYQNSPVKDPPGGAGATRVLRGGSWYWQPEFCRSSFRHFVAPDLHFSDVGFRVVLVASEQ